MKGVFALFKAYFNKFAYELVRWAQNTTDRAKSIRIQRVADKYEIQYRKKKKNIIKYGYMVI